MQPLNPWMAHQLARQREAEIAATVARAHLRADRRGSDRRLQRSRGRDRPLRVPRSLRLPVRLWLWTR